MIAAILNLRWPPLAMTLAMRNCISPTLKLIPLHNLGANLISI
jgi:hypothetical protein